MIDFANPDRIIMVAEMSANHLGDLDVAMRLVRAAAHAGADAVKTQCWYPGDMAAPGAVCKSGPWAGRVLNELYEECRMPMEWHEPLKAEANRLGLAYFSTPFSVEAVSFLEALGVPAYKVASFEIDHVPLLERIAATGKPCMFSIGEMPWGRYTWHYLRDHIGTWYHKGHWTPLHCVSQYPALPESYPINDMYSAVRRKSGNHGLSDHTLTSTVAIAAAALGARVIEKHLTLARSLGGPDAGFSTEPKEFRAMVDAVRVVEAALKPIPKREPHELRRGLWVTRDVKAGEKVTSECVGILRPRAVLTPVDWQRVQGKVFAVDVEAGTALVEGMVG